MPVARDSLGGTLHPVPAQLRGVFSDAERFGVPTDGAAGFPAAAADRIFSGLRKSYLELVGLHLYTDSQCLEQLFCSVEPAGRRNIELVEWESQR